MVFLVHRMLLVLLCWWELLLLLLDEGVVVVVVRKCVYDACRGNCRSTLHESSASLLCRMRIERSRWKCVVGMLETKRRKDG